jgi:hypothetical protein
MGEINENAAPHALAIAIWLSLLLLLCTALLAAAQGRVSGMITDASDGITLDDGTWFGTGDNTRVVISSAATIMDIGTGQYVAITAARLPDGSLLASTIAVFPESQRGSFGGQFEMASGDLMTNAHVQEAVVNRLDATELLVSFGDNTEKVLLTPVTNYVLRVDGSWDDVQTGAWISANLGANGVASSVTVER